MDQDQEAHSAQGSVKDDEDSDFEDEASGGLSNNIESQEASESESINQGELETELPPALDIPMIPPIDVTDTYIQAGIIDPPESSMVLLLFISLVLLMLLF